AYLAREAHAAHALALEHLDFCLRPGWLRAGDELDATRCAAGVPAAGVLLIDAGVLLECENEALPIGHEERAHSFDSQLRHDGFDSIRDPDSPRHTRTSGKVTQVEVNDRI